jgi:hypothetical protein
MTGPLTRRFGMLSAVACLSSIGVLVVIMILDPGSGHVSSLAVALGALYTFAASLLSLVLALAYWSSREWHYLWRWAVRQVGGTVPAQELRHGRLDFLAERMLGVACFFCSLSGIIGWVSGSGPASVPPAIAGSLAVVIWLAAGSRDVVDGLKAQFGHRRDQEPAGRAERAPRT